ncbi:MAG: hypothetical protein C5B49_01115 [Bdellovibrio sp.]|nr:MAG: hypothetical protein C5B49_01115 [Bdellovibrio sp.]
MKASFSLVVLLFICIGTRASDPACKTVQWPLKSDEPFSRIKLTLDNWPREKAIQLAWGEMLKRDQNHSVAFPVLQYLQITEQRMAIKGYFKVMAETMTGGSSLDSVIKIWPKRSPAKPIKFDLKALCEMYHLAATSPTEEN